MARPTVPNRVEGSRWAVPPAALLLDAGQRKLLVATRLLFPIPCLSQSSRSNCAGFTRKARAAGMKVATRPISVMVNSAPASTSGSRGLAS